MKKTIGILFLSVSLLLLPTQKSDAQIAAIIKAAITKAIKALDLQVQRIQTQTIWLQNAQKVVENTMSQLKLNDITDWVQKQKDLYGEYYQELWKVKAVISYYTEVKDIINRQVQLVNSYKQYNNLFKQDKHFTADELNYMGQVYTGILDESAQNLDKLYLVINSFATQMSDAERLKMIRDVSASMEQNYTDLQRFNDDNVRISLQRAKEQNDVDVVKKLYGLP
jgi:hypothetical protein